jgi:hypothetical protein
MHSIRLPLWILAASGGYILCLFVPQILNDGDTYMHIAARVVQTLEQRGIQRVIVGASPSIRAVMEALSGWSLLYADTVAAVYSRTAAP